MLTFDSNQYNYNVQDESVLNKVVTDLNIDQLHLMKTEIETLFNNDQAKEIPALNEISGRINVILLNSKKQVLNRLNMIVTERIIELSSLLLKRKKSDEINEDEKDSEFTNSAKKTKFEKTEEIVEDISVEEFKSKFSFAKNEWAPSIKIENATISESFLKEFRNSNQICGHGVNEIICLTFEKCQINISYVLEMVKLCEKLEDLKLFDCNLNTQMLRELFNSDNMKKIINLEFSHIGINTNVVLDKTLLKNTKLESMTMLSIYNSQLSIKELKALKKINAPIKTLHLKMAVPTGISIELIEKLNLHWYATTTEAMFEDIDDQADALYNLKITMDLTLR